MRSRGSKKPKKNISRIKTPFKIRCMFDCSGDIDPNSVINCTAPKSSKGVNSAKVNDESNNVQDSDPPPRESSLKELFGKNNNDHVHDKLQDDIYDEKKLVLAWKIGRNYSMRVGKIGRIDEDQPCDFKEVDVKRYFYPRCRSLAFGRQNLVY
ncbi:hypothetical protein LIER_15799 [Lithospermum erythrorhizon]|uniref:Uncharacterized protein n=1 Tax=Lithospermum erythrorhizon TaxID=34254 RepID=A0AAV3Q5R1_LITER